MADYSRTPREAIDRAFATIEGRERRQVGTTPTWSLPTCVAWAYWLDLEKLTGIEQSFDDILFPSDYDAYSAVEDADDMAKARAASDSMREELALTLDRVRSALISGALVAYGVDIATNNRGSIRADQWPLLFLDKSDGQVRWGDIGKLAFREVCVSRPDAMALWPASQRVAASPPIVDPEAQAAQDAPVAIPGPRHDAFRVAFMARIMGDKLKTDPENRSLTKDGVKQWAAKDYGLSGQSTEIERSSIMKSLRAQGIDHAWDKGGRPRKTVGK